MCFKAKFDGAEVVHVCVDGTAAGSRVHSQMDMVVNSSVWVKLPYSIFDYNLVSKARGNKKTALVFHQQSMLPLMMITWLCLRVAGCSNNIVYDMHDLSEFYEGISWKAKIGRLLFYILELMAARVDIQVITVSKGLSDEFFRRYRKTPAVVYNVSPQLGAVISCSPESRAVYFGQIQEDRLPIYEIKKLAEQRVPIDLYGFFPVGCSGEWKDSVLALVKESGGSINGEYSPDNMLFLARYKWSWMVFGSERKNIEHCMPNKLFQSLSQHLICIVSPVMVEVVKEFAGFGAVLSIEEMVSREEFSVDWAAVDKKVNEMHLSSIEAFRLVVTV